MKKKLLTIMGLVFLIGISFGYVIADLGNFGDDLDKKDRTIQSNLDAGTKTSLSNSGVSDIYFDNIYSKTNGDGTVDIMGTLFIVVSGETYEDEVMIINDLEYNRVYHSGLTDDEIIDLEAREYADSYLSIIEKSLSAVEPVNEDLGLGKRTIEL